MIDAPTLVPYLVRCGLNLSKRDEGVGKKVRSSIITQQDLTRLFFILFVILVFFGFFLVLLGYISVSKAVIQF